MERILAIRSCVFHQLNVKLLNSKVTSCPIACGLSLVLDAQEMLNEILLLERTKTSKSSGFAETGAKSQSEGICLTHSFPFSSLIYFSLQRP